MLEESPERHISFERVVNFRDLGGYATTSGRRLRWRKLFRSGLLQRMTANDVERARQLGITSVLDLRLAEEAKDGLGPFVVPPVQHHALWLGPEEAFAEFVARFSQPVSGDLYFAIFDFNARGYAALLELLSRPETYPAVVHCTLGKDRTGIAGAIVLSILGVDRETIVEDYALSRPAMDQVEEIRRQIFEEQKQQGRLPADAKLGEMPQGTLAVVPEAIAGFLQMIDDQFGSMRGYFEAHGVRSATFQQLETILLE